MSMHIGKFQPVVRRALCTERRHLGPAGRLPERAEAAGACAAAPAPLAGGEVDGKHAAARRARGVRAQPGVDAGGVKAVAALRQHAHGLAVLELREADGTLVRLLLCRGGLAAVGDVCDRRKRAQHLLLDALVRGGDLPRPASGSGGPAPGARAPCHEAEAEDADERAEQAGEDENHVRVEGVRLRGRRADGRFDEHSCHGWYCTGRVGASRELSCCSRLADGRACG
jgi:hypothetical protein